MSTPLLLPFPRVVARAAEAQSRLEARRETIEPQQLFLPGLDEFMRAMPNHIARSSLFAPVARGRKRIHKDTVLVSRADAVIKFWGEQLDEAQADVWMQAMHEASRRPLGEPVIITRSEFLRSIGRQTGNYEYKWLNRTMQTLTFAMLVIEVRTKEGKPKLSVGKNRALHMIEGFDFDDEAEAYTLRVDPRWRVIFDNREFALIDWEKRLRFGARQDMAKALQRLAATSDESVQRYALDWLKAKLEYTGRMRDFVDALQRAMRELERLEIIAGGRIETSTKGKVQAVWIKL
ncbi:plasmid replication initiator TrfA [Burkholderia ubonensis]|uniref:plasmid replication initiator TrfA n=1 Tax=Burkholderia ubonensis TaxID=101571 RepID=UPI000BA500A6|nr:plasmid replication initiator TrfA [Burkholderia ubonensis]PAJ87805.1 plasmid stabilization protein [Burkholderia ubonensis]PAK08349.1 plasmid stabilization protein [Burkholderia ubonensis]RQP83591.1 plasmid stabilization protein [Burkholderia ubonensis]RQQ12009.1 plasmid stabilization protein [Burkholderia ubonensis]